MSKIAILNDLHIGARQDSVVFAAHQAEFWKNELMPYLTTNKIKTLYMLGDVFDRRKYINFRSLSAAKENLFDPLLKFGIDVVVTIGNHDIFYRESNEINSPKLLLSGYPNIRISEEFENHKTHALCPWINEKNKVKLLDEIKNCTAPVLLGHFEIAGIEAEKGMVMDHGMDGTLFGRYHAVGSGHYHHKSTTGNIHYFGTQYQLTWNDADSIKGFHVFDTETLDFIFVPNAMQMFHKLYYTDSLQINSLPNYTDKCVKMVVPAKRDNYKKDRIVDAINAMSPFEFHVADEGLMFVDKDDEDEVVGEEISTIAMIKTMIIEQLEVSDETKDDLVRMIDILHTDAISLQTEA